MQLVPPALLVGRGAGDRGHLQPGEIAVLPASAVGQFELGYRQAVDLWPVLGIELNAVDGGQVEIVLGAAPIFAAECDDVAGVGGIIGRDGETGAALLAVEIGHRLTGESVPDDLQRRALARHQRIEVDVRIVPIRTVGLGEARRGEENSGQR